MNKSIYKNNIVATDEQVKEIQSRGIGIYTILEGFIEETGIRGDEPFDELVRRFCVPPLGGESIIDEWGKYGYTYTGIRDGYIWKDNLKDVTELEAWKMLALSNIYWRECEKNYRKRKQQYSLDKDTFM